MNHTPDQFSLFANEETKRRLEQLEEDHARLLRENTATIIHSERVKEDYGRLHEEIGMLHRALKAIWWRADDIQRDVLPKQRAAEIMAICNHPETVRNEASQ